MPLKVTQMYFHKQSPAPHPPSHVLNTRFPFLPKTELLRAAPGGEAQVAWEFLVISSAVITKLGDCIMRHIKIQTNKKKSANSNGFIKT